VLIDDRRDALNDDVQVGSGTKATLKRKRYDRDVRTSRFGTAIGLESCKACCCDKRKTRSWEDEQIDSDAV